jgi:NADH-quinone oxidoreductase subunit L
MAYPLIVLAVGAVVTGFFGIPPALGGADALGHFLEPSFAGVATRPAEDAAPAAALGVMLGSVLVALAGILAARHLYQSRPDLPRRLADRWRVAYAILVHTFYVDEIYNATIVRGTLAAARGLEATDRRIIDGAVDAAGSVTRISAWFAHMFDKHIVDALVNLFARGVARGSFSIRRLQSGLVQNYALLMVFGLFAFLTVYLLAR